MMNEPPWKSAAPMHPSERLYEELSPEAKERVLREFKKWMTDHRTAPRQKRRLASDDSLPRN